jgi:hypothetical protein
MDARFGFMRHCVKEGLMTVPPEAATEATPPSATEAQAAFDSGDHARAAALWQAAWTAQPGDRQAAIGVVRAFAALGKPRAAASWIKRLEATHPRLAEAALRIGARKLPQDIEIGAAWCASAAAAGDEKEAAARWWALRRRLPRKPAAHCGYIDCMLAAGRHAEAERAVQSARRFLGDRPELLAAAARVADSTAHTPATTIPMLAAVSDEALTAARALLTGFESIGRNCEFGLLQRKYGAEPLGLLRFSTTRPATLLELLRTQFDGIGDPARNEVVLVKGEYRLRHLPSGWRMHTGIAAAADPATVLRDQCRHTGFLRTKLLRELRDAVKIFVYQMQDIEEPEVLAIYDALQEYGPNHLLAVRLATGAHEPGAILWPRDRLMLAHIDRQGQEFNGAGWDISQDYWLHFCTLAKHWQGARGQIQQQAIPA